MQPHPDETNPMAYVNNERYFQSNQTALGTSSFEEHRRQVLFRQKKRLPTSQHASGVSHRVECMVGRGGRGTTVDTTLRISFKRHSNLPADVQKINVYQPNVTFSSTCPATKTKLFKNETKSKKLLRNESRVNRNIVKEKYA